MVRKRSFLGGSLPFDPAQRRMFSRGHREVLVPVMTHFGLSVSAKHKLLI